MDAPEDVMNVPAALPPTSHPVLGSSPFVRVALAKKPAYSSARTVANKPAEKQGTLEHQQANPRSCMPSAAVVGNMAAEATRESTITAAPIPAFSVSKTQTVLDSVAHGVCSQKRAAAVLTPITAKPVASPALQIITPLPKTDPDHDLRTQRRTLHHAVTIVLSRLASSLEVQTAVRRTLQSLRDEDVCRFLDTTYQYLCDRFLENDTAAMLVVMQDLAEGVI